ncbi:MAG: low-specificity L-threonine aldolase [Anaerolineae bacterium]|jgi:threonine aldolase
MQSIDLRSDTVTLPTPAMREAMATAEVGDDVMGEDPTVNRLEAIAAERVGKEAALFVTSGTMGNLVALLTHCGRGDEIIVGDRAHVFLFEAGGASALGGIHSRQIPNLPDGRLDLSQMEAAIRPDNPHFPRSRLICLENTHNRCGGACLTPDYMRQVRNLADKYNLQIHLDGARVFNAAVALALDVRELTRHADSVSFCLSKGLSAPVGSLVCGPADFIRQARRARKVLGGGMRQAGIIAAAGIVALEQMVDRLADDHANAHRLAEGLADTPGIILDPGQVQTNIVIFEMQEGALEPSEFCRRLANYDVKMSPIEGRQIRAVTHHGIEATHVEQVLDAVAEVMA